MQSKKPATTFDLLNHLSAMIADAEREEHKMFLEFTDFRNGKDPQTAFAEYTAAKAKARALSVAWSELSRLNTRGV